MTQVIISPLDLPVRNLVSRQTPVKFHFGSPFFSEAVVMDTFFCVTLFTTVNETLKWLSLLPTLMQNDSGDDSVALGMVRSWSSSVHCSKQLDVKV